MMTVINGIQKDASLKQPVILAFTQSSGMDAKVSQMFVSLIIVPLKSESRTCSPFLDMLFASFFTFNLTYPASLTQVYGFLEALFELPLTVKLTSAANHLLFRIS